MEPVGVLPAIYKHVTPRGVKPISCFQNHVEIRKTQTGHDSNPNCYFSFGEYAKMLRAAVRKFFMPEKL